MNAENHMSLDSFINTPFEEKVNLAYMGIVGKDPDANKTPQELLWEILIKTTEGDPNFEPPPTLRN
jgi:hypothetical protein